MSNAGLRRKLGRAFLLQAGLISAVAALGVYVAGVVLEEVLVKQALRDEANYFWHQKMGDASFPMPDTRNLTGYLYSVADGDASLSPELRGYQPGFHKQSSQADYSVLYVTERGGLRLLLVFDGENVSKLAFYFGLVPLAGVLMMLYMGAWVAYRQSRRAVSPIITLAREVHRLDPEHPDSDAFKPQHFADDPNQEVMVLAEALHRFALRINEFVERERAFTRDASHELRSPLTVIKIAANMLLTEQELGHAARNSVLRIKRSATDMEELVDVFLLLARESEQGLSQDPVCVNEIVAEEIGRSSTLLKDKPVEVRFTADVKLTVMASEKVLSVLIGNLIRNAFSYTDQGTVEIHVGEGCVRIEDSGVGMPKQDVEQVFKPFFQGQSRRRGGFGVGLTIVKRLSERFNWPVSIDSKPEVGTKVVVEFPGAASTSLQRPA
jgi:signal transduction histidine kinase